MSKITLNKINKYFDENHVLKGVDLEIKDGEFMTLLGPSGCGKTTLLRVIAGLENPEKGIVAIGNSKVVHGEEKYYVEPGKRSLNLVFQSYALWPHMTVFENVAFGLSVKKLNKADIKEKVTDALRRMQIENLGGRYPSELSGGQQQRVAIARAIVTKPKVLLLDEPLSNLDAKLRVEMRTELKRLHHELQTTIIYVTHDQIEALTLSTRIAVFFAGELVQVDTPQELYRSPSDIRVAEFIGNPIINFISGVSTLYEDYTTIDSLIGVLKLKFESQISKKVTIALKPEDILLHSKKVENSIECKVYSILPAGSETLIQLTIGDEELLVKVMGEVEYKMDDRVWITFKMNKICVYDDNGKNIKFKDAEPYQFYNNETKNVVNSM